MRGLKGKSAVVTGGSRGIGKAIAARLLEEGASVLFTGRNAYTGEMAREELSRINPDARVVFLPGDMKSEMFCAEAIRSSMEEFGELSFLVNNAFPFTAKGVDATREDWIHTMEAGPIAYATMISQFVKQRPAGSKGAVVNISSVSGHVAQPNRWTYNTAKGAVIQLTRCAAMDLAPHVRVNIVSPGWVWTDEVEKATQGQGRGAWEPLWGKFHMLRRLTEPEEIASVAAFLLSDDASFITGADIDASGGYLAMGSEGLGEASNFAGSQ